MYHYRIRPNQYILQKIFPLLNLALVSLRSTSDLPHCEACVISLAHVLCEMYDAWTPLLCEGGRLYHTDAYHGNPVGVDTIDVLI